MTSTAGKFWLPKFDPAAAFVVAAWPAGQTVGGIVPTRGEAFDKTSVSACVLEELYTKRWIAVEDAPRAAAPAVQPKRKQSRRAASGV